MSALYCLVKIVSFLPSIQKVMVKEANFLLCFCFHISVFNHLSEHNADEACPFSIEEKYEKTLKMIQLEAFSMVIVLFLFHFFTTTTPEQSIKDGETLVSTSGTFEMGFLRYLGIWYKKVSTGTVVWVANREASVSDASGVLSINDTGVLSITNSTKAVV
ncbi:hypothetical protein GQ457_13G002890 [Hibiscus cannabinus]